MIKIACFSIFLAFLSVTDWHSDIREAKQLAEKEHKHILLNADFPRRKKDQLPTGTIDEPVNCF